MLAVCEEHARAGGAELLRLDCTSESDGLIHYYCEQGYTALREVKVHGWRLIPFEKRLRETPFLPPSQAERQHPTVL